MIRVVGRRLSLTLPLLFVVSVFTFLVTNLSGDAARQILGPNAPAFAVRRLRHQLGLDRPLYSQYWHWLHLALHGDLGRSFVTAEPVSQAIQERFPVTLSLVVGCVVVMFVGGVGLGVFSAIRGGAAGRVVDGLSMIGLALPNFWIGAILISFFAVKVRWFPAVGYVPLAQSPIEWLRSLVLPLAALSVGHLAWISRQTREAMLDVLASEHIRMARANGIGRMRLTYAYALKNAGIRVVTLFGLSIVGLLAGTVFVETVFAMPGLGGLLVSATQLRDLPTVQGVTIFFTLVIVVTNLAVDLAYASLDPRVRSA